ncbi:unnamed protein product [Anisakis simplex]|uniref:Microtubule-associated protein futsch (inferred by orthology to a D. melanogaster protein) n=1 Tax=Anisakis simplex TaxID=6269 RepID=A0A0M3J329_ANISI|nr:unnamed protein product [Anisakis simplex]
MPVPPVQLPQPELDDSLKPDTLSEQDLLSKPAAAEIDHPEANEDHRSPIEDLLDGKSCPFTAGLACAIVDDATSESAFRKLSSPPAVDLTKNVADLTKPTELDTTGAKIPNGTATLHSPMKLSQRSAPGSSLGDSLTSPLSPDSTNTQVLAFFIALSYHSDDFIAGANHPALDDVIENLAGESEREDNVRDFTPDSEDEKHLLQQQHCQQEQQELLHRKTNGGTEHNLAAQHAQEDADAGEFYMPPITGGPTHRMRASVGGPASQRFSMGGSGGSASNKPKLSQPLYFDVVFIPHRGAHPTLPDEAAAKAFATSVRSKRYVISGKDAIKPYILDGLVAGKTLWNKPGL